METFSHHFFPLSSMKLYHEMKQDCGAVAARSLVRKELVRKNGNVTAVANALGCSRLTVRRARDGILEDEDRTPHLQPRKTQTMLTALIVREQKKTHYGRKRLHRHLKSRLGIIVSAHTLRHVLRREGTVKRNKRRSSRESKPLYDYEHLLPFEEGQIDTKYVDDYGALGDLVFLLRRHDLPPYQWTYVDAKTKTRFLAYSYSINSTFGCLFLGMILLWLRSKGITTDLHLQGDNGSEWCRGSKTKEAWLNAQLHPLQASFRSIPAGKKYLQGIVERSHRTDDEEFYRPHLEKCTQKAVYLRKAQQWQDTYNALRPSEGKGMGGMTPLQKLEECGILHAESVLHFPVVILDELLTVVKGGNYLLAHYHFPSPFSLTTLATVAAASTTKPTPSALRRWWGCRDASRNAEMVTL